MRAGLRDSHAGWFARSGTLRLATLTFALLAGRAAYSEQSPERPTARACVLRGAEKSYEADIRSALREVDSVWPMPPSFIRAVIQRESAFNPAALSSAGAIGLMQVLPSNAARLGMAPQALWNPGENILAGTRLLAVLLRHYQGDVISALVAYNARPRSKFAPLPDNGETPAYVRAVLRFWARFERCEAQRPLPVDAVPSEE